MKIGLFGGSFDPIHYGHIRPVELARRELGLERVIYLPTASPPHKPGRQFAPPHARFAMVELALLDDPEMRVSAYELTPDRPAYTVDTVEHYRRLHPSDELHLLIGGDSFAALESWSRWRDLVRQVRLVVLVRPGWEVGPTREHLSAELTALAEGDRVHFLANPRVDVSSTELRERVRRGLPIPDGCAPDRVLQYIRKYGLYS